MDSRKRVRSRVRGTSLLPDCPGKACEAGSNERSKGLSTYELIAHSVHSAEVYRTGRVALQFLAQFQDMVIHGAGPGIIFVSPNFVQQFVPADGPVGILRQKLQGLEFL